MDKKTKTLLGFVISFGGGLVIFIMGLLYDLVSFNPYSSVFWMIFLVLIVYFALGANIKNIPGMIVSYVCGLAWGFVSNIIAYMFIVNQHILFAFLCYFVLASLIVLIHQFIAGGTVFGFTPCAFLGLAESIMVATCSLPDANGQLMPPNTWNFIDLFIIYIIGIIMVTGLALFTGFLAKKILKNKNQEINNADENQVLMNQKES